MSGFAVRYLNCAMLNCRAAVLALGGRWLGQDEVAASYDRLSEAYADAWLGSLRPVTDALLSRLDDCQLQGEVLDLGCGTGYSCAWLERRFPDASVVGVDISAGMLRQAAKVCSSCQLVKEDLLAYLESYPAGRAAAVVSAWALGYSTPSRVVAEVGRVLAPGGVFAFVVNYADTLGPVFRAYRRCMNAFPERLNFALWPKFPPHWKALDAWLRAAGMSELWHEDGEVEITPRRDAAGRVLPWLLDTGVLAGFDQAMPLLEDAELRDFFEAEFQADPEPLKHHYALYLGKRR